MSPRGLVLGNSHAACLREAWRQTGPRDAFTLDFFAAHREQLDGLEIAGGEGRARTGELRGTLDKLGMPHIFQLDAYDFFVVTACQLAIFRAVEASNRMAVWPDPVGRRVHVSAPAFREALADRLRETTAHRLVRSLAGAGAPILVLPQPNPHESILLPTSSFAGFRRVNETGRGAWLTEMFRAACDSAMAGMARVLHQPGRTRSRDICTSPEFSEGSIMLAARRFEHKASDVIHANAAYGAVQLGQIAGALADQEGDA